MRLIILALLGYLLYRLVRGLFQQGKRITRTENGGIVDEMVQDPVCKTYIPLRDAQRRVIGGREYFFCSKECADKFELEDKSKQ
ncbi:MAG: transcriptional regulator [Deltaproteobacteria bacterium]|nr:MAG: transcriptional regulator [Deltaproteobacteria bacterium]